MQVSIFNRISSRQAVRIVHCTLVLWTIVALSGCTKEESAVREYPRLNSLEVTGINESGAVLNAEITSGNTAEVIEYGFVWNKIGAPALDFDDHLSLPNPLEGNTFSAEIHTALIKGVTYHVKPWLRTSTTLVYGQSVSFISMGGKSPEITDFNPKTGIEGDTIQVTGKYLWSKNEEVIVKIGEWRVLLIAASETQIKILVPPMAVGQSEKVSISLIGKTAVSGGEFIYK